MMSHSDSTPFPGPPTPLPWIARIAQARLGITRFVLCLVLAITALETCAAELFNGLNDEGTLLRNQTNIWTFSALEGESLIIRTGKTGGDTSFHPWLRLHDPSGTLVQGSLATSVSAATELALTATLSGTYTLIISDGTFGRSDDGGTYRITLLRLPGTPAASEDGGALANGGNNDGTITLGDMDPWTFSGKTGDRIVLRSTRLAGLGSFSPRARLYDPHGKQIDDTGEAGSATTLELDRTLDRDGTFTLIITDGAFSGSDETGSYRLILTRLPGTVDIADDGGPLIPGNTQDGAITAGDVDPWTFTAQTGDRIVLRAAKLNGHANFNPWMRLFDPTGQQIGDTGSGSVVSIVELATTAPRSGTFTVLVGDGTSGSMAREGSYRMHFVRMPHAPKPENLLANNQPVLGSIRPGDLHLWQFFACRGSLMSVRMDRLTNTNSFDPQFEIYGPQGGRMASSLTGASSSLGVFAAQSGFHGILIRDSFSGGLDGFGEYLITVMGILNPGLEMCQPYIHEQTLDLAGHGGASNAEFVIYTSPDLEEPRARWTPILTNRFDASGFFNLTNIPYSQSPQRFYYLIQTTTSEIRP